MEAIMDTILIVDDNPDVLFLVQTTLEAEGYRCRTAADGVEAQALVKEMKEQITAILLDWKMPRMSGIELLRWIKSQAELADIPVIMQTVMDRPENVKEGIDAGAFYYLPKLTESKLLQSIVRAAVSDFRQKKALLDKIREGENPFALLVEGNFRLRTLAEGEYLALEIANACAAPETVVAISELINNAVEHGNLGISYDEKTEYIKLDTFYAEIDRRLAQPEYAEKYVHVRVKKGIDDMTVLITDQGPGFDFEKYLVLDESRVFHLHGRGIALANRFTDLQYLGTGNQVLITIPFT